MSTIARTATGTPVASTATGGPAGAAPVARSADDVLVIGPAQRLRPERAAALQPALLRVDHQYLGAALERDQRHALPDRSGAQHDDLLAGGEPASARGANGDRHRLGHRRERSVGDGDREHLLLSDTAAAPVARRRRGSRSARSCRTCWGARRCTGSSAPHARSGHSATRRPTSSSGAAVRPQGDDRRADLVPLDAGELRTAGGVRQLAGEEVVVRTADADRLRAHDHLAGAGLRRVGPIGDHHRPDPLRDGGVHVSPRPRRRSRRSARAWRPDRRR